MQNFRIAAIPVKPMHGDPAGIQSKIISWIQTAAASGAKLIVFPEGILSAYDIANLQASALTLDSPLIQRIHDAASDADVVVSVGFLERSVVGYHVSNVHLGRDLFIPYRKCHLTETEKTLCVPGQSLVPQRLPMVNVGTLICYDSAHPRAVESLVRRGAELLVHSSCHSYYQRGETRDYPTALAKRREHVLKYWRAKAYDYSCYAVQVDNVGETATGEWFPGYTAVFGPDGSILAEVAGGKEEMVVADLDGEYLAHCRENWVGHFKALADARTDLYV